MPDKTGYIERITDSSIDSVKRIELCLEALQYWPSIEIWCLLGDLLVNLTDNAIYTTEKLLEIMQNGYKATKLWLPKAHLYWNIYVEFLERQHSEKVEDAFLDRLRHPCVELDAILSQYSQFVTKIYPQEEYTSKMDHASAIAADSKKVMILRDPFELSLLKGASLMLYTEYLDWEKERDLKLALYLRAACDFPESIPLWMDWIWSLWLDYDDITGATEVAQRALAFNPNSAELQATALRIAQYNPSYSPDVDLEDTHVLLAKFSCMLALVYSDELMTDKYSKEIQDYIDQLNGISSISTALYMLSCADKSAAKRLWSQLSKMDKYRSSDFQAAWLEFEKTMLIPDISQYYELVLQLPSDYPSIVHEKLRVLYCLADGKEIERALRQKKQLDASSKKRRALPEVEASSKRPSLARNREETTLITTGVSDEQLDKLLTPFEVLSRERKGDTIVLEFSAIEDKLAAYSAIRFSKDVEGSAQVVDGKGTLVWVTNFPEGWSKEDLQKRFSAFGDVLAVRLPSRASNQSRRFGYIQFARADDALVAVDKLDGSDGLVVKLSDPLNRGNRQGAAEEGREIFIGGLDKTASVTDLEKFILLHSAFTPSFINIPASKNPEYQNDGYGFVIYHSKDQAAASVDQLGKVAYAGKFLRPRLAVPKRQVKAGERLKYTPRSVQLWGIDDTVNSAGLQKFVEGLCSVPVEACQVDAVGGTAIVTFKNESDAGAAGLRLPGQVLNGRPVHVGSKPRTTGQFKPRSLQ